MAKTKVVFYGIEPMQYARLAGTICVILGLILGAFATITSIFSPSSASIESRVFGAFAIVWAPVVYGLTGFVFAGIGAAVLNKVLRRIGGLVLHVDLGLYRDPSAL